MHLKKKYAVGPTQTGAPFETTASIRTAWSIKVTVDGEVEKKRSSVGRRHRPQVGAIQFHGPDTTLASAGVNDTSLEQVFFFEASPPGEAIQKPHPRGLEDQEEGQRHLTGASLLLLEYYHLLKRTILEDFKTKKNLKCILTGKNTAPLRPGSMTPHWSRSSSSSMVTSRRCHQEKQFWRTRRPRRTGRVLRQNSDKSPAPLPAAGGTLFLRSFTSNCFRLSRVPIGRCTLSATFIGPLLCRGY
ncbi:unnamed protein product [Nezara viridula]|uniref:Uncharacterized protein n=1 Tax=Nezara viridula TaxID=85310 RepID=A0A9P0GUQ3_NEZVI|nr:unnamed protein product [Nezara viridula]